MSFDVTEYSDGENKRHSVCFRTNVTQSCPNVLVELHQFVAQRQFDVEAY